jgi:hypothetical protein
MGILDKVLGNGAKGVIEGVANTVDKFVHTKDEAEKLKAELEMEITKRWQADASGDSWLSKNVRPLSLVSVLVIFYAMLLLDGNVGEFSINNAYLPIYNQLLLAIVSGYFIVRTVDKRTKK